MKHGCCHGKIEAVDLRRVTDIHFSSPCWMQCINRGTITITSDDPHTPVLKLSIFGAKEVFKRLR